jgi:uncharacterized protein (UPF0276 family)
VNNVFVSAHNHGFDAYDYVRAVPHERIVQVHLAGHTNVGKYIIDTHCGHVIDPVWDLYRETIRLTGSVSTLVEWDDEIPELPLLLAEAERARVARDEALSAGSSARPPRARDAAPELPPEENTTLQRPWNQGGPREVASAHMDTAVD